MINHARTLLLNLSRAALDTSAAGVDYVDAGFRPLDLTGWMLNVRQTLFGRQPEQNFINHQLYKCLRVLHSTEYVSYVTALDPRLTYDVAKSPFRDVSYGLNVTAGRTLEIVGKDAPLNLLGISRKDWTISRVSFSAIHASLKQTGESTTITLSNAGNKRGPITLPGAAFKFYIPGALSTTDYWTISSILRPTKTWTDILRQIELTPGVLQGLFSTAAEEPYKTFWGLWTTSLGINYKLSGLLLAYIYRLEALRNNGN